MNSTHKQHIGFLIILLAIVFFVHDEPSPVAPVSVAHADVLETIPTFVTTTSQENGDYQYLDVTAGCAHDEDSLCIWAYARPSVDSAKVYQLEKGMLLKVVDTKIVDGETWYHVRFDESLRYPERTPKDWYVPSVAGNIIRAGTIETLTSKTVSPTNKRIVVDISDQMIYAYEGDKEFLAARVSTGEYPTVTPLGTFKILRKTPTRYMQGPQPGVTDVAFDLPGVSWDMYFTQGGAAIHGTYWHNNYGTEQSDGCVNLPTELAKMLYDWAPLGTVVTIQN